eukprot:COSAG02_NODE_1198_length_13931_cov_66.449754_8_plen_2139_part_00
MYTIIAIYASQSLELTVRYVQVMKTVASIQILTAGKHCRLMQLVHAIRVFGAPCTERRPVDTTMLTHLFIQLERDANTRDMDGERWGTRVLSTDAGFFTTKDELERERILDCMKLVSYEAGVTVFEQDQLSDGRFFFVLAGEVEIKIVDPSAPSTDPPSLLKIMSNGCSFGDRSMAALDAKRTACVTTATDCLFGVLQRPDFLRITRQFYDSAVDALERSPEERTGEHVTLLENVLGDCAFFRRLRFKTLASGIVKSCTHKRLRKNELLFKDGDEAKCFYVVVRGHVRVVKHGTVVAVLGPGESFGETGVTGVTAIERQRTATIVGGAVPGAKGSPLGDGLESPKSPGATPSGNRTPAGSRRSEVSYTDLAVISRDDYLRLNGRTDDTVKKALRERPSNRTEEQISLLHTLCRATKFFQGIRSQLVEYTCCRYLKMQTNAPGDILFSEGDTGGDTFYIIVHGSVSGTIKASNSHFRLEVGDSFGDLALSGETEADRVRSATIVCQEETMFATLSRVDYLRVSGKLHTSALRILNCQPEERDEASIKILEGYLSEIKFFQDMHFPLLKQAICKRLKLTCLQAGQVLYTQGDESTGRYYMLLQGAMEQEAPQAKTVQQYRNLQVPDCWGDSTNALHPDTGKVLPAAMFQCSRTITALPLTDGAARNKMNLTVKVSGVPAEWKASDIWRHFTIFGPVVTVNIHKRQGEYVEHRWAEITFADCDAAKRASQGGQIVVREVNAQLEQQQSGDHFTIQDCVPNRFQKPEHVAGSSGGRVSLSSRPSLRPTVGKADTETGEKGLMNEEVLLRTEMKDDKTMEHADVLVAYLSRGDFLECCHAVITKVMDALASPPRSRSLQQLELIRMMFSTTDLMQRLCSSTLVQRNCCRFLGIATAAAKEVVFKKRQSAEQCFTILTGHIDLFDNINEEPLKRGPGAFLGDESIRSPGTETYDHTAVASSPLVLAVMHKSDYFRICHTETVQAVIDKFWNLGLAHSKSEDPSLLDFQGYKQVYLRLGKVIATKQMFSQKELRTTMKLDWKSDLEMFGDPALQVLTHEQYSDSMYQFIDEWAQAVESTQLYGDLLQLILDNMTTLNPKTGIMELLPLPKIQCCYQRIKDLCHAHDRMAKTIMQESSVGRLKVGQADHVAHFKKVFSQKGIFQQRHAVEETNEDLSLAGIIAREREYIADMFNTVDVDGSGSIDRTEVGHLSKKMGWNLTEQELDAALIEMDPSGDGEVDLEEFTSWIRKYTEDDEMVRSVFEAVDADGSGVLDYDEVELMLSELGVASSELSDAVAAMDGDDNGNVDVNEFIDWWRGYTARQILEKSSDPLEDYYRGMFDRADNDGSGHIDALELESLLSGLGMPTDVTSMQLALAVMDENCDGEISWKEFKAWLDSVVTTETEVSEFCENGGIDLSQGGVLSFQKVREAIDFLCERNGQERIDDELLRTRVFHPGATKYGGDTISFDVLSKWWLAYQADPGAQVSPQHVQQRTLVSNDDHEDQSNTSKKSETPVDGHKNGIESEGGWEASGGAGEIWAGGRWVSVGEIEQNDSEEDKKVAKNKRKERAKAGLQVDVTIRARKEDFDAQLLAKAEAAEERQRRRAKRRSEQMLAKRAQNTEPRASSRGSSRGSVRGVAGSLSAEQIGGPLGEFADFTVKKLPRPRTTDPGPRLHSSGFRRLTTAPYQSQATHLIGAPKRQHTPTKVYGRQPRLVSHSMPDLERPASAEWRERDITIVPARQDAGDDVVKMPSVLRRAGVSEQRDRAKEEMDNQLGAKQQHQQAKNSAEYLAYAQMRDEEDVANAHFMNQFFERDLVVQYEKLALQQPQQQLRSRRIAHTAAESEFYETVNWDYQGPSPRSSPSPSPRQQGASSCSESEVHGLRHEAPCSRSVLVNEMEDQLHLGIAGQQSPRHHSPRTNTQIDAVRAVAGPSSPFTSPRSKAAAKAMLLDHAQMAGILARANHQRSLMRVPTPASIAPDLEASKVPPGAVAKKSKLAKRDKYKTPTERMDRSVLQWFAEHGSAKRSMKTMSRGSGPQRKAFARDWRSPPGCEWKLAGNSGGRTSSRASLTEFRMLRRPSTSSVLGSYGSWSTANKSVGGEQRSDWRLGADGLSEQDRLWNQVVGAVPVSSVRPTTSSRSSRWVQ